MREKKTLFLGRVAIEYISSDPAVLKKKYAFKCHRLKVKDNEMVFPVSFLYVVFNCFSILNNLKYIYFHYYF